MKVKWNFKDEARVERCFGILSTATNEFLNFEFYVEPFCECFEHKNQVDVRWSHFIKCVNNSGRIAFDASTNGKCIIQGWNEYVKEFYDLSRTAFLKWKSAGSRSQRTIAEIMRQKRAHFKIVLREA